MKTSKEALAEVLAIEEVMDKYGARTTDGLPVLVVLPGERAAFMADIMIALDALHDDTLESADADSNPSSSTDKETRRSE